MKKVFIINGNECYHTLFNSLGFNVASSIEDADLVCFTGGEDVSPDLYNHRAHPTTYSSWWRDQKESEIFRALLQKQIPMVGICRGGQFLNVMSGGEMYQHVEKHTRSHSITDLETGETVFVSSTHHQMMKPAPEAVLVAYGGLRGNREFWNGEVFILEESELDYEVVYYENTRCLCFQPHPEFEAPEYEGMRDYFGNLLFKYFQL